VVREAFVEVAAKGWEPSMIVETSTARGSKRTTDHRRDDASAVPLVGVLDLAERLGTSERFVRRLVSERRVPFHKVGKFVRFDPEDIDIWLADHRVEPIA
jgi:excisionase family DNA binding protein